MHILLTKFIILIQFLDLLKYYSLLDFVNFDYTKYSLKQYMRHKNFLKIIPTIFIIFIKKIPNCMNLKFLNLHFHHEYPK